MAIACAGGSVPSVRSGRAECRRQPTTPSSADRRDGADRADADPARRRMAGWPPAQPDDEQRSADGDADDRRQPEEPVEFRADEHVHGDRGDDRAQLALVASADADRQPDDESDGADDRARSGRRR